MSGTDSIYEVLALRYGTHQQRTARDNFMHPQEVADLHEMELPLDYFVWVIRNAARTIVVDTGFTHDTASRRKRVLTMLPIEALAAVGVDAKTVTDVIITHLHYDHAGSLASFPAATLHVQDTEMGYVTGRCMCHPRLRYAYEVEDVVTMVRRLYEGRVNFIDGDATLFPGVSVHKAPGHTPGLQCVRVQTARGAVVLASDAAHFYANMERQNPFPEPALPLALRQPCWAATFSVSVWHCQQKKWLAQCLAEVDCKCRAEWKLTLELGPLIPAYAHL